MARDDLMRRRHPVHGVKLGTTVPMIVFLTACTRHREPWLATSENHRRLIDAFGNADAWAVGRYVVMPDHVHLFCSPRQLDLSLELWVKFWKSMFSRSHSERTWRWQTDHWDTRMRSETQYEEKWQYVRLNPVRARLVKRAEDWPYAGELARLPW